MAGNKNNSVHELGFLKRYPLFISQFIIVSTSIAIVANVITAYSETIIKPQTLFALILASLLSFGAWALLTYQHLFKQTNEIDKQIQIIENKRKSGLITQEEARAFYRQLIELSIENIASDNNPRNHDTINVKPTIKESKGGCNG